MSRRLTNGDTCSRHILTHSDALRGWRRWQRDCKGKGELRHVRKLGKENAPESPPYIIRPGLRSPPARLLLLLCCSSSRTLFHLTFSDTRYIQLLLFNTTFPIKDAFLHAPGRTQPCCHRVGAGDQLLDAVDAHFCFSGTCSDLLGPMYAYPSLASMLLLTDHRWNQ